MTILNKMVFRIEGLLLIQEHVKIGVEKVCFVAFGPLCVKK